MTEKNDIEHVGSQADSANVGEVKHVELGSEDVAAKFLAKLDPAIKDGDITSEEARRVLWKIDLIVLPIIAGTVILSAVDKVRKLDPSSSGPVCYSRRCTNASSSRLLFPTPP